MPAWPVNVSCQMMLWNRENPINGALSCAKSSLSTFCWMTVSTAYALFVRLTKLNNVAILIHRRNLSPCLSWSRWWAFSVPSSWFRCGEHLLLLGLANIAELYYNTTSAGGRCLNVSAEFVECADQTGCGTVGHQPVLANFLLAFWLYFSLLSRTALLDLYFFVISCLSYPLR